MDTDKFDRNGLTFDDVSLKPAYSEVLPAEVQTKTWLTESIQLNIPIASAAMDTVTEAKMAIGLSQEGGIGVLHRNLPPEAQALQVDEVKRYRAGMIAKPVSLRPDTPVTEARRVMEESGISGITVTDADGRLLGIFTNRDLQAVRDNSDQIGAHMTDRGKGLVTCPPGTTLQQAVDILQTIKKEKLPVVDEQQFLCGMYTLMDARKQRDFPNATLDSKGRLRVAAALGTDREWPLRAQLLFEAGVDVFVLDTAHGHSAAVIETLRQVKRQYELPVIVGNIATADAARDLIDAGADALKVGIGPGSICTTRVVAGVGVPQITAIYECTQVADPRGIPVIADGGITYSGDIAKAIAAGADLVMLGQMLAGTEEAPGEVVIHQGEHFKEYRGMGSLGAMRKRYSSDRYSQEGLDTRKLVPEGIEGRVPYRGKLSDMIHQLIGGLRAGMGYCGAQDIDAMKKARFVVISAAGLQESHARVTPTVEAVNYRVRR